tara:strand:- start:45 stop:638 length:594 start_codon:yes stop_codon:yes gene_type:complete
MANFKMKGHTVFTQTGNDAPILNENVNLASATFPSGHVIQTLIYTNTGNGQADNTNYAKSDNTYSTSATSTPNWSLTKKSANSNILVDVMGTAWTGSHNNNAQEGFQCFVRHSLNSDMSSATDVRYFYMQYDTRGGDNPPQQTAFNANGIVNITTYTSSAIGTVIYFDVKKSTYGGLNGGYTGNQVPLLIRIQEIQQ